MTSKYETDPAQPLPHGNQMNDKPQPILHTTQKKYWGVLHNNGMSLFQDLKLKRRKVDSRASSDGESIGTSDSTASLSPHTQPQPNPSPKHKDRCLSPEEIGGPNGVEPTKSTFPPDAFIFMIKAERATTKDAPFGTGGIPKSNGVIQLTPNGRAAEIRKEMIVVKSEPKDDESEINGLTLSSKRNRDGTPERHSVQLPSPVLSPSQRPRCSPVGRSSSSVGSGGSDNESIGSSSCKSDKKLVVNEELDNRSPPPLISRLRDPNSPPGHNSNSNSSSTSGVGLSPQSSGSGSSLGFTKVNPTSNRLSPSSSRVPSPHLHLLAGHHPLLSNQSHLHARLTTGPPVQQRERDPVQPDLRTMVEKADPLSVVTSTSLSFHHHSLYRINGVRPEVISGGAVTPCNTSPAGTHGSSPTHHNPTGPPRKSPSNPSRSPNMSPYSNSGSSIGSMVGTIHSPGSTGSNTLIAGGSIPNSTGNGNHHHVNLNRTPTVIMGEAGGVRTMLWSQNLSSDLGISDKSSPNGHHYPPPSPLPSSNSMGGQGHDPHNSPPHHNGLGGSGHPKGSLSMERLWASEALNLSTGGPGSNSSLNTTNSKESSYASSSPPTGPYHSNSHPEDEECEQPMICMICEDRATGLHYGIITCEGCKGFFKRTVQNRRVYTCVADGTCEITKAQRNRCQYCRFKKCIEQGMVLQAVREDRMPGGRNSGAVYNLYKVPVKYRKHKKGNRNVGAGGGGKLEKVPGSPATNGILLTSPPNPMTMTSTTTSSPPTKMTGTILKAALTSPNEVNHLRQAGIPFEQAAGMITHLVQCDNFHDIAALQNWEELLEGGGDLSEKLCQMGDSIVYRLVQWTKRLPFYQEVPVEVHTRVLTHKWHELLVLTTSAWQAMHTPGPPTNLTAEEETMENIQILQRCLQAMMGRSLTLEQLRQDVGQMVERLTYLTRSFRRLGIRLEEYVTLKVIAMLQNTGTKCSEVTVIQERYIKCLKSFLEVTCPSHPNRLNELLRTLPEVQSAASLLLESKMFYVPFLLNSALLQR